MFTLPFKQIKKALGSWKQLPSWIRNPIPLGKQIYMIRSGLGMTQGQLAARMKTSQRAVVRLEKEESDPQLSTLRRIADSLHCELFIRFIPKTDLEKILQEKAQNKAEELLRMSMASANLELQKPSQEVFRSEVKRIAQEALQKKRSSLWE